jgi:hypothetical protein
VMRWVQPMCLLIAVSRCCPVPSKAEAHAKRHVLHRLNACFGHSKHTLSVFQQHNNDFVLGTHTLRVQMAW